MLLKSKPEEKKVDPRIKRTRQMLVEALRALMSEKSFHDITVHDIAERATVNRVTFYAHFADKNALLEYTMREMIKERLRQQAPEDSRFSRENLMRLIVTVAEFLTQMGNHCPPPRDELEPLMEKQIKAELNEVLKGWLLDSPSELQGRGGPELAAMMASWAIYGAVMQWKSKERREPATEFAQQVLPIITASLSAPG